MIAMNSTENESNDLDQVPCPSCSLGPASRCVADYAGSSKREDSNFDCGRMKAPVGERGTFGAFEGGSSWRWSSRSTLRRFQYFGHCLRIGNCLATGRTYSSCVRGAEKNLN